MKAVSIERLEEGMVLGRTVTNGEMVIVLSEGTVLNKAHITRLKSIDVPVVYIKDEADLANKSATAIKADSAFTKDFEDVSKYAEEVFEALKSGQAAKAQTDKVASNILPLADNSGTIDFLFSLGHMNTSLALHSERVAIMSGILAKWMHFSRNDIKVIVTAAFLHDVGKIKMPDRLIGRDPDNLNDEDFNTYKNHCVDGATLLKDAGFDEMIQNVALCHHEKMNGEGFPNNLNGEAIPAYARIVKVADIYDNLTSEKLGAVKQTPFDAAIYFAHEIYSSLDPVVCVPLLTHIKDSLIGSRVTLSDGRSGIVAMYPNDFSALPIISLDDGTDVNLNKSPNLHIADYEPI